MLLLLFATVIGITYLHMTEDPKPTASMLGDSVIKAEVKKEVKKEIIPVCRQIKVDFFRYKLSEC